MQARRFHGLFYNEILIRLYLSSITNYVYITCLNSMLYNNLETQIKRVYQYVSKS